MSKPAIRLAALGLLLAAAARCDLCAAAPEGAPETRLDAFLTPDGTGYFALRLVPNVALPKQGGRDVVILFDTSATQTGDVRQRGIAALETLLASLQSSDRFALLAVDLDAVPLTDGFVSPHGEPMDEAMTALRHRAPLGATDMPTALAAGAATFEKNSSAPRAMVYIGDSVSAANFLVPDDYRRLLDILVEQRIPVSSYGVGVRVDGALLASLANHTGGNVAIDGESIDPKQVGVYLASAVRGTVVWPTDATWPEAFAEVYPKRVPPLRSDRDTIVVGKGDVAGEQTIVLKASIGSRPQSLTWTITAGESNADFAFLVPLVESARGDDGLSLATAGTTAMREVRRVLDQATELLARLSRQAIVTGNLETAEQLAAEALRRDPNDPTALAVKKQLAKLHAGEAAEARAERPVIKRFTSEQAAPPISATTAEGATPAATETTLPAPSVDPLNDGQGSFLDSVDQQRRLITAQVRAEVDHTLRERR